MLTFIGAKMLLPLLGTGLMMAMGEGSTSAFADFLRRYNNHEFEQAVINISLGVVAGAILLSILISMVFPAPAEEVDAEEELISDEEEFI